MCEFRLKLGFKGIKSVGLRAVDSIHCGAALVLFSLHDRAVVGRLYQHWGEKAKSWSRENALGVRDIFIRMMILALEMELPSFISYQVSGSVHFFFIYV